MDNQSKWQSVFNGLMAPAGEALKHPAADMLLDFARAGCPVNTGPPWSKEQLKVAIKGAHPSVL
jgi:hypothetical protein